MKIHITVSTHVHYRYKHHPYPVAYLIAAPGLDLGRAGKGARLGPTRLPRPGRPRWRFPVASEGEETCSDGAM
jgi:hypothetical protein